MKIVRYGVPGAEQPGLIDEAGDLRSLADHCTDIDLFAEPSLIERLGQVEVASLPTVPGPVRFGPPIAHVSKFIAIGLNFADHAAETGQAIPEQPIVFMKAPSCIVGANDDLILPLGSEKTDFEVELGLVIGKTASYVTPETALDHVAGYIAVHDVSERHYQLESGGTWDKGKGCDTFGPIGPWLVTRDEVPDPQELDMELSVNGTVMQHGNTRTMIFSCAELVSYVSRYMTLLPGDIITTGTPPGVGMSRQPPVYLRPGDRIALSIKSLGSQRQQVRAHPLG